MDATNPAMLLAAAALHNADNALLIARRYAPRADAPATIDDVRTHIREALDAIAAEIGDEAMLRA